MLIWLFCIVLFVDDLLIQLVRVVFVTTTFYITIEYTNSTFLFLLHKCIFTSKNG